MSRPGLELSPIDRAVRAEEQGQRTVVIGADGSSAVDPFVLASAVASATSSIRILVRVPTDQWHPYLVARRLAALDKISGGRIDWWPDDPVDTRRDEAVHIVAALLTSWAPDAVVNDRAAGLHVDTDRVMPVHVHGTWFAVDSPLDVCAGPQGVVPVVDPGGVR